MKSPLEAVKEWYLSLPMDQRIDISAMVGMMCPGFEQIEIRTEPERMVKLFLEKVESCFGQKTREIGMTLTLRASIEFFFIDKRSDPDHWKESEQMLLRLADEKNKSVFKEMAEKKEFMGKQWVVSCKKWHKIRSEYLNDSYLNTYFDNMLSSN